MVTTLPPMGFQARIPLLQILQVLDQLGERRAFKIDQPRLSQVMEQIANDPEKRGYYISQSLPRMQSRQGRETMLEWAGKKAEKEKLYTLKPEERLVTGAGEERARGVPKPEKAGKGKPIIVKPGEHVWDPIAGKDVFNVAADASKAKRWLGSPGQQLMDAGGKVIHTVPSKPPEEMTEKEIGKMIEDYTKLEGRLASGAPMAMDPTMFGAISMVQPDIAKQLLQRDVKGSLKIVRAEKQFWKDRMIEIQAKRMYPRERLYRDKKGFFLRRRGKKHYFRLEEPKASVR